MNVILWLVGNTLCRLREHRTVTGYACYVCGDVVCGICKRTGRDVHPVPPREA